MTVRHVYTGCRTVGVVLLGLLAACSSSAEGDATGAASTSAAPVTTTTAVPPGTPVRWQADAIPGVPKQECNESKQCVLLGTERITLRGDVQGTSFTGTAAAFGENQKFVVGRTDVFRGTVKGCGAGTLVIYGTEIADVHRAEGEWRIAEGFGTGDLAGVTGHGIGRGTVDDRGFHSQWEGVIDCGR
jgi:hypothetical protein